MNLSTTVEMLEDDFLHVNSPMALEMYLISYGCVYGKMPTGMPIISSPSLFQQLL